MFHIRNIKEYSHLRSKPTNTQKGNGIKYVFILILIPLIYIPPYWWSA